MLTQNSRVLQYHLTWTVWGQYHFRTHLPNQGIQNSNLSSDGSTILAIKMNAATFVFTNKLYVKATNTHSIWTLDIRKSTCQNDPRKEVYCSMVRVSKNKHFKIKAQSEVKGVLCWVQVEKNVCERVGEYAQVWPVRLLVKD